MARPRRIVFELVAQLSHVDAQVVRLLDMRRPPDIAQQLALRDDLAEVARQHGEQPVFNRRQVHGRRRAGHDTAGEVHANGAELHHGITFGPGRDTAQCNAIPRQHLPHPERLGEIVVGTGIQRGDLVRFVGARRQHDDRHRTPAAQIADELDAVEVRQPEVQHDEIGFAGAGLDEPILCGLRLEYLVSLCFQRSAHEAADLLFILHDQHGNGRCVHGVRAVVAGCGISSPAAGISGGEPSGSRMMNLGPPPGPRSARIFPRWASTMARLMASPRPTPGVADSRSPRANFSNIASSEPGTSPGPLSATMMRSRSPRTEPSMRVSLPFGVYLAAFSKILTRTRSNNTASISTSGRSAGRSMRSVCAASNCPSAATALPTTSSSGCHWRLSLTFPPRSLAQSSRLLAHAFIPIDSSPTALAVSRFWP